MKQAPQVSLIARRGRQAGPAQVGYAYESLKERILDLGLQPGQGLNVSQLAVELGISRTPVREALGMLERDGLVTRLREGGYRVAQVTLRDAMEAFTVQAHLEVLAVELALPRLDEPQLESLRARLDAEARALKDSNLGAMNREGMEFHSLMVQLSDNRVLAAMHRNLLERLTHLSRISFLREGRAHDSHDEHLAILQALRDRDKDRASEAIRSHLRRAIDNVVALLSERGDPAVLVWPAAGAGPYP